jgi:hypothetical protein
MRKTQSVTITDEGRDKGKSFFLTELSPEATEWWALRAFLALAKSGVEVPDNLKSLGAQGLAVLGIQALAKMDPYLAKPLLDEMWTCVKRQPDPQKNPTFSRDLVPDDIEEVTTLLQLRAEIWSLHLGFSIGAFLSGSTSGAPAPASPATRTFRRPSGPLSPRVKQR